MKFEMCKYVRRKYVLINNYLDKVLNFLEVNFFSVPTDELTQGNSRVNENHLQDDLQILKDAVLNSPKTPVCHC